MLPLLQPLDPPHERGQARRRTVLQPLRKLLARDRDLRRACFVPILRWVLGRRGCGRGNGCERDGLEREGEPVWFAGEEGDEAWFCFEGVQAAN